MHVVALVTAKEVRCGFTNSDEHTRNRSAAGVGCKSSQQQRGESVFCGLLSFQVLLRKLRRTREEHQPLLNFSSAFDKRTDLYNGTSCPSALIIAWLTYSGSKDRFPRSRPSPFRAQEIARTTRSFQWGVHHVQPATSEAVQRGFQYD